MLALDLLLQPLQRFSVALLELLLDLGEAVAIILTLECRRDGSLKLGYQVLHIPAQIRPAARRQPQRHRLVGILEVIHITPVVRALALCGLALEELAHRGVLAGTRPTQDVEVVAARAHAHAEPNRIQRALLAYDRVELLQLLGGLEVRQLGPTGPVELLRPQGRQRRCVCLSGHGRSLLRAPGEFISAGSALGSARFHCGRVTP